MLTPEAKARLERITRQNLENFRQTFEDLSAMVEEGMTDEALSLPDNVGGLRRILMHGVHGREQRELLVFVAFAAIVIGLILLMFVAAGLLFWFVEEDPYEDWFNGLYRKLSSVDQDNVKLRGQGRALEFESELQGMPPRQKFGEFYREAAALFQSCGSVQEFREEALARATEMGFGASPPTREDLDWVDSIDRRGVSAVLSDSEDNDDKVFVGRFLEGGKMSRTEMLALTAHTANSMADVVMMEATMNMLVL